MKIAPVSYFRFFILASGLFLSSCAEMSPNVTSGSGDYVVTPVTPDVIMDLQKQSNSKHSGDTYTIGTGDVLTARLNVPGMDEYSLQRPVISGMSNEIQQTTVMDNGYASFPYAGELLVAGKTLHEATNLLQTAMSKYFRNPQISLEVKEFNSRKVFVMGAVARPSLQYIKAARVSVAEALSNAQGMDPAAASYKKIYVIRGALNNTMTPSTTSPISTRIYQIDASSGTGLALAAQFPLKNNDVLFVSPTAINEWNKIITQLLPYNASMASNASYSWTK